MPDDQVFSVRPEVAATAHVSAERYQEMAARAKADPEGFWAEQADRVAWMRRPTKIKDTSFGNGPGTDVHHLRPTNVKVNSIRGSKDFDEVMHRNQLVIF